MYKRRTAGRGFSLIELLIVIAIVGILAGIVYANFGSAGGKGRDAKRQADLRVLQTAIEQYKSKYGQYPAQGCGTPASSFATERDCPGVYVEGLVPEFLPQLPTDPKRGTSQGFAYITNNSSNNIGTVYKAMVMNTVETETVTYTHPLRSCDMSTISRPEGMTGDSTRIMCGQVIYSSNSTPSQCVESNSRFRTSYGVWGGYAYSASTAFNTSGSMLDLTQRVICR